MYRAGVDRLASNVAYPLALAGLLVLLLWAVGLALGREETQREARSGPTVATTDDLIGRVQARLRAVPADPDAYVELGGTYLQKARETGDWSHVARAQAALQRALELDGANAGAMSAMAALALTQHQFDQAATWARRALERNPRDAAALGALGDAQAELGLYDDAFQSYQRMVDLKPSQASYARVSYARELVGDVEGAIAAMRLAVDSGAPRGEPTAWAMVQLGNLYFASGRLDDAVTQYEAAQRAFKDYYAGLGGMARVRAAQGQYQEAARLYERAVAMVPQPSLVAALGDLYALMGERTKAELQYATVEVIARLGGAGPTVYNRELALYYADHGLKLDEAIDLARRELEVRKDIYGYDALAWTLCKAGQTAEAVETIGHALKLGTQDPLLLYHAGLIFRAAGDAGKARSYLERALALNPHFALLHEGPARDALAGLRQQPPSGEHQEGQR